MNKSEEVAIMRSTTAKVREAIIMSSNRGEVTIRPMEQRDIDAVLAIYNKIRDEKIPGVKRSRLSYRGAMTYEEVASTNPGGPLDLSLVAEVNDKVIGFIWSGLAYVGIPVDEVGVIYMLIVDPDYQKKGIAHKLVEALAERCQIRGINTVRAVVNERHWELQNYFQKLGFSRSELVIYTRISKT